MSLTQEHKLNRDSGTYGKGLSDEQLVIEFLQKSLGMDKVRLGTREEDINQDIDVHVAGVPCSIKAQHTATRTGNVCFELETVDEEGVRQDSWYRTGKAMCYLILIENTLYQIWKEDLALFERSHGWDRLAGLKPETQQLQRDIGHKHVNVSVGLIRLKTLMQLGIIREIGKLNINRTERE